MELGAAVWILVRIVAHPLVLDLRLLVSLFLNYNSYIWLLLLLLVHSSIVVILVIRSIVRIRLVRRVGVVHGRNGGGRLGSSEHQRLARGSEFCIPMGKGARSTVSTASSEFKVLAFNSLIILLANLSRLSEAVVCVVILL